MGSTCSKFGPGLTMSKHPIIREAFYSNLILSYAYASRRGSHSPTKGGVKYPNQDRVLLEPILLGPQEDVSVFGVFDGHGDRGQDCAAFASEAMARCLKEGLMEGGQASDEVVMAALKQAFQRTNKELEEAAWDTTYSGTTAVVALVVGRRIFIGHVGDAKAVMGTVMDVYNDTTEKGVTKLSIEDLTSDHRPGRLDERQRITSKGGIILSTSTRDDIVKQTALAVEGAGSTSTTTTTAPTPTTVTTTTSSRPSSPSSPSNIVLNVNPSDPLRVWDKNLQKPGSCFTRSLGDGYAQHVGIISEPDVAMVVVPEELEGLVLVLGSDGVFDGRTTGKVMDQVSSLYSHGPVRACHQLVSTGESHGDRTAICLFIHPNKTRTVDYI